jgi:hypothetical protein
MDNFEEAGGTQVARNAHGRDAVLGPAPPAFDQAMAGEPSHFPEGQRQAGWLREKSSAQKCGIA